jgi:hypothetical protein
VVQFAPWRGSATPLCTFQYLVLNLNALALVHDIDPHGRPTRQWLQWPAIASLGATLPSNWEDIPSESLPVASLLTSTTMIVVNYVVGGVAMMMDIALCSKSRVEILRPSPPQGPRPLSVDEALLLDARRRRCW